jgi:hypothetical protein
MEKVSKRIASDPARKPDISPQNRQITSALNLDREDIFRDVNNSSNGCINVMRSRLLPRMHKRKLKAFGQYGIAGTQPLARHR